MGDKFTYVLGGRNIFFVGISVGVEKNVSEVGGEK